MATKKLKRVCQLSCGTTINFKQDIPAGLPFCLSIDGENFVMTQPRKIQLKQSQVAPRITVLRGPYPVR